MGGGYVTYTLTSELEQTGGTKVQLGTLSDGRYPLNWQKNDLIQVLCDKSDDPVTFTLSTGAGSTSAEFTATDFPSGATPKYAVYATESASPTYDANDNELKFSVPQEIGPSKNNIKQFYYPAVAEVGQNNSVNFKNVFGLLQVKFTSSENPSPKIRKIVLHDLAGNNLWGICHVPILNDGKNDGKLDYENATVTGGSNTLTMTFTDDNGKYVELKSDGVKSYFFPVPVGALDDGFSIVLYEYDATKADSENPQKNKVGRAYSFLQKVTGTQAIKRSDILYVSANVSSKPEAYDAKARGYYKSLFVNAGTNLDKHFAASYQQEFYDDDVEESGIPAIGFLGLENDYEYFASNQNAKLQQDDLLKQSDVFVGDEEDRNGVLLYPDGSPRFRMVYCNGGKSEYHGKALTQTGRDRFHDFFYNGGSYSGSCAGSFLASTYVDDVNQDTRPDNNFYDNQDPSKNYTFGLFPGQLNHTTMPNMNLYGPVYTNMEICKYIDKFNGVSIDFKEKVEDDYEKGSGSYTDQAYTGLEDVKHHGGSYLPENQVGNSVEVLMRYRFSRTESQVDDEYYYRFGNIKKNDVFTNSSGSKIWKVGKEHRISTWAYKNESENTGRIVCTGSHPEATDPSTKPGDQQYTAFMFQYAMDGNGAARVKYPDLQKDVMRSMNESPSIYDSPERTNAPIGDRQYHHFKFESDGIENFVLRLDSRYDKNSGIDLYLGLRQQKSNDGKKDLAWLSEADYTLCNKGGQKELHIKHLPAGIWYVSVFCATKVDANVTEEFPKYFKYSGKTEVLNGIPYSIKIFTGYPGSSSSGIYVETGTSIMDD